MPSWETQLQKVATLTRQKVREGLEENSQWLESWLGDPVHMAWETYEFAFKTTFGTSQITEEVLDAIYGAAWGLYHTQKAFIKKNPCADIGEIEEILDDFIVVQFQECEWFCDFFPDSESDTTSDDSNPT